MIAKSIHGRSSEEINAALRRATANTYGEYGRALKGKQEFHSTTCCWVALKEK